MGIFSSIVNAIFGSKAAAAVPGASAAASAHLRGSAEWIIGGGGGGYGFRRNRHAGSRFPRRTWRRSSRRSKRTAA